MTGAADSLLAYRIGASTIGGNLERAVQRGDVKLHWDGSWELTTPPLSAANWHFGAQPTPFACPKLFGFLFRNAYGRGCVPFGCRNCFKVQVKPRTLRQLNAMVPIAETAGHAYKAGVGLAARYHGGPYSTLFYFDGLEQARAAHAALRRMIDSEPLLGSDVAVAIKRGCTEYEVHCGPSDRFAFAPELETIESALLARLQPLPPFVVPTLQTVFMRWLQAAFQIDDETYRDFTGGRSLHPAPVTYAPDPADAN